MAELFFPRVESPVYQGARIVAVAEGLAGYDVEVYVNGQNYGQGRLSVLGRGAVRLTQPLKVNDQIFAMQVGGDLNNKIRKVVTVQTIPADRLLNGEKFDKPVVATPLYECQRGFWVNEIVEGVQITCDVLSSSGSLESSTETETPWRAGWIGVAAPGLKRDQQVRAKQAFPAPSNFPGASDYSAPPKPVKPAPNINSDSYQCEIKGSVSIGSKVLEVDNTLPGARVRIYAEETDPVTKSTKKVEYGERVSAGGRWPFELDHPLTHQNPKAVQLLCDGAESPPSEDVTIKQVIGTPEIETPICPGSTEVTVLHTEVGATIEVQVKPKGQSSFTILRRVTASGPVTPVNLGQTLQSGDEVQARQSNDGQKPANGWTPIPGVSIGATSTQLTTELRNDDNPGIWVFYLGQTVKFRTIDCQSSEEKAGRTVTVIHKPTGTKQSPIALEETKTGYFEAAWPIPLQVSAVPVGRYIARFEIPGHTPVEREFWVIGLTLSDTQAILAVHNKARAAVKGLYPGVNVPPPLTWSHDLAKEAQEWANHLAADVHDLIHAKWGTERDAHGESIAPEFIANKTPPAQLAEEKWITGEKDWFIPPCEAYGNACSKADPSDPQKWKPYWKVPTDAIGHYTQALWGKTKEVGCGLAQDLTAINPNYANVEWLVARYSPSGNLENAPVFSV